MNAGTLSSNSPFPWLLANEPVASVIAGASHTSQVAANAAAGSWVLSVADLVEVDSILGDCGLSAAFRRSVVGPAWSPSTPCDT